VASGLNVTNDGSGNGGVAVDAAGNVYIADTGNKRVLKETLSNGSYAQSVVLDSTTYLYGGSIVSPDGIAVDAAGAVYIVNENFGVFKAVADGATYTTTPVVFSGITTVVAGVGASIDAHGTLYIADLGQIYVNTANELAESASAENFGSLNVGATAAPQTATFTFDVGGTLASIPYAVSTQGDLTLDFQAAASQAASVCVTGKTYNAGDTCTVAAVFTPTRPGARYGAIALRYANRHNLSAGDRDEPAGQLFSRHLQPHSRGDVRFRPDRGLQQQHHLRFDSRGVGLAEFRQRPPGRGRNSQLHDWVHRLQRLLR
jgi:hypothetical protein